MAIYRSDQAQLTFAAETVQGADAEMMLGTTATATAELQAAANIGDRSITINTIASAAFVEGDMVRIGAYSATNRIEWEVRRIEKLSGTQQVGTDPGNTITVLLDRPLQFAYGATADVKEISAASDNDDSKYITFLPGVYESVDTPDPEMTIEGRRFLGTEAKRNWNIAYSGQQTLTGSVGGITLINGWPLRFPFGKVTTVPSSTSGSASMDLPAGGAKKGDTFITIQMDGGGNHNLVAGDYICIYDAANTNNTTKTSEVRRVVGLPNSGSTTGTGAYIKLNYPLSFDHAENDLVAEVASSAYYTHEIVEENDLSTVSWHVHMKDSGETAANNFDRRYLGGMIGSATLSAEEGGMLSMSWDSVNFMNMVHNQNSSLQQGTGSSNAPQAGDLYFGANPTASMPRFSLMQSITQTDVGEPYHNGNGNNDGTGYPSTAPYYFSQGTIKMLHHAGNSVANAGVEVAKIRSFAISVSNGEEPRYYISQQGKRARGPYEIREGAREYSMSATIVLPDSVAASSTAETGGLEFFKQLLLEGDFGGDNANKIGFAASLKFERGTNDFIIIDIPTSSTAGTPTAPTNQLNKQGLFILTANHGIGGESALEVDLDMTFRSLRIVIEDSVGVYP